MFTHGGKSWDDLLAMEGQIRKRRQKEVYDKQVFREKGYNICRIGSGSCCWY